MPSAKALSSAESPSLAELFARLPLEVLRLIIEQAARMSTCKKEAARYCLVSKVFLPRVQRELYRSVTIRYERWDVDDAEKWLEDPQGLLMNDAAFLRTLTQAPHLSAHLRELTIECHFYDYEDDALEVRDALQAVFNACPRLPRLVLRGTGDWIAADDVAWLLSERSEIPPLEELDIMSHQFSLGLLLRQLPHLRKLHVRRHDDEPALGGRSSPSAHPPYPFSLIELDYDIRSSEAFLDLAPKSHSTLRTLRTSSAIFQDEEVRKLLPSFTALHYLEVLLYDGDLAHLEQTVTSINSLPSVQHLSLVGWGNGSTTPHLGTIFRRLPFSVQTLNLENLFIKPSAILPLIDRTDLPPLPNLQLIRFSREVERVSQGRGEPYLQPMWREALEACSAAGVAVEFGTCDI